MHSHGAAARSSTHSYDKVEEEALGIWNLVDEGDPDDGCVI
jgi:hypothetical protein